MGKTQPAETAGQFPADEPKDAATADVADANVGETPAETAAPIDGFPPAATVRVKANANITLGGVTVPFGETDDVPDGVETRQAIAAGLATEVDAAGEPVAQTPTEEQE